MPTFTYTPLTATSYRVSDAHTREEYGVVSQGRATRSWFIDNHRGGFATKELAAAALYRTRTAFGFEAGVL